jgi:uncharacterized protein (DUF1919 family)
MVNQRKTTPLLKISRHAFRTYNRLRLRNRNFTLITNTCIGGIIYHELGLQFLSPTINCGIRSHEQFFTFCTHLQHYTSLPLTFIQSEWDYPVAILKGDYGDITIYFSHYKNQQQANNKWEQRKKRINWNNIIIVMDGDNCTDQQIAAFDKIPHLHKVIYTIRPKQSHPSEFPITDSRYQPTQLLEYGLLNNSLRWYELLDIVRFLNTGQKQANPILKLLHTK